jgi:hypothetical protein
MSEVTFEERTNQLGEWCSIATPYTMLGGKGLSGIEASEVATL